MCESVKKRSSRTTVFSRTWHPAGKDEKSHRSTDRHVRGTVGKAKATAFQRVCSRGYYKARQQVGAVPYKVFESYHKALCKVGRALGQRVSGTRQDGAVRVKTGSYESRRWCTSRAVQGAAVQGGVVQGRLGARAATGCTLKALAGQKRFTEKKGSAWEKVTLSRRSGAQPRDSFLFFS